MGVMVRPITLLVALVMCCGTLCGSTTADADDAAELPTTTQEHVVALKCARTLTPIDAVELARVLRASHQHVFDRPVTDNGLAMAWAQVAFENAGGRVSYNHNLGNVCSGTGTSGEPYFRLGRYRFRSFDSFDDAADAYWRVIKKCSPALRSFNAGLPHDAAARLKRCRYYEADEELYSKNLSMLFYQAKHSVLKKLAEADAANQEKQDPPQKALELDGGTDG